MALITSDSGAGDPGAAGRGGGQDAAADARRPQLTAATQQIALGQKCCASRACAARVFCGTFRRKPGRLECLKKRQYAIMLNKLSLRRYGHVHARRAELSLQCCFSLSLSLCFSQQHTLMRSSSSVPCSSFHGSFLPVFLSLSLSLSLSVALAR